MIGATATIIGVGVFGATAATAAMGAVGAGRGVWVGAGAIKVALLGATVAIGTAGVERGVLVAAGVGASAWSSPQATTVSRVIVAKSRVTSFKRASPSSLGVDRPPHLRLPPYASHRLSGGVSLPRPMQGCCVRFLCWTKPHLMPSISGDSSPRCSTANRSKSKWTSPSASRSVNDPYGRGVVYRVFVAAVTPIYGEVGNQYSSELLSLVNF